MSGIVVVLLKTLLTKLVTEKVLIAVFLHLASYLVSVTTNELDDKIVEEIKKALAD